MSGRAVAGSVERVPSPPAPRAGVILAAAADAACILTFAAIGRASHAEAEGAAQVLRIAWPFLAAGAVAWVVARARTAPRRIWREGVMVWALTWAGGMALRGVTGGGLAPAFLLVGAVSLGALLVGWRAVAALVSATRSTGRVRGLTRPEASTPLAAPRPEPPG